MPLSSDEAALLKNNLLRAAEHIEAGQTEEAVQKYQEALGIDPQNIAVLHQMAKLYENQENFAAAAERYTKAIAIQPDQPFWVYRHLGFALEQQGQLHEAIAAYEKAIALQPQDDSTYSLLGKAQQQTGNLAEAISCYQQAIDLNPQQPVGVYIALGDALSHQEMFDEAIWAYEKALELEPDNIGIQGLLADVTQKIQDSTTRLEGGLEQIDGCLLKGWVRNSDNPDEKLTLIIYSNQNEILQVVADLPEADLNLPGERTGNHGFAVRLPLEICQSAPFDLEIVVAGFDWVLSNSSVRFEYQPIYKPSFQGHCDPNVGTRLGGWALDNANLSEKIDLYVYDENQFLLKISANWYRPDLNSLPQWQHGDGYHGYTFELPERLIDRQKHRLHICYENSAVELHNSPIEIEPGKILSKVLEDTQKVLDRSLQSIDRLIKLY